MSSTNGSTNGGAWNGASLGDLKWSSSEQVELEQEQDVLRADLAAARERLAAAHQRIADRDAAMHEALREELAVAQQLMADMEERHRADVAAIHDAARVEAERILMEARTSALPSTSHSTNSDAMPHGQ
jgi:hypothetical protein